jgi:probable HAF family extracellular repeat protein
LNFSIADLGTLGGTLSFGYGINNRGQAVGTSSIACNCDTHAFLWAGGVLHDLTPGQASGDALGINDRTQVVGESTLTHGHPFLWSRDAGMTELPISGFAFKVNNAAEVVGKTSNPTHAFLWNNGRVIDLGTFGGDNAVSGAYGINNSSEVVGQASGPNFLHAFSWTESGGMKDLGSFDGTPGGTSGAADINDHGQIVGSSYSNAFGTTHAAYFTGERVVDLGTLGGFSSASAVNNNGQVVGDSFTFGNDHAFLTDLEGGPMLDLNTLIPPDSGWTLLRATGINDAGQIVGIGQLPGDDVIHAFVLTPEVNQPAVLLTGRLTSQAGTLSSCFTFLNCRGQDEQRLPHMVEDLGSPQCGADESLSPRSIEQWAGLASKNLPPPQPFDALADWCRWG